MNRSRDFRGQGRVIRAQSSARAWRHIGLMMVVLALALKVLIPPGTMIAAPSQGVSFPLVLCTGQGPRLIEGASLPGAPSAGKEKPAQKSSHDAPCLFAGHGAAKPIPPPQTFEPVEFIAFDAPHQAAAPSTVAPGRGLAAPPPPPRGPPLVS